MKTTNKNKRTTEQTIGKITEKIPDMNVGVNVDSNVDSNVDTDISTDALLEEIQEYLDDVSLWHPILRSPSIFFVPNPQYRVLVSNAYTGLAYNVMLTLHVWDMPVYEVECRRVSYNREVVYIPVSERRVVDLRERIGEGKQDTFNTPYPSNKEMRRVLDDLRHPIDDLSIDTDLDVESDLHKGLVLEDNLSLEELVDLGDVEIEEMEVGENNSRDSELPHTR